MIILDDSYVSPELVGYLEASQASVLDNTTARRIAEGTRLNLVKTLPAGERVITFSEAPLPWVLENTDDANMHEGIRIMKDKAALRRALAPLYPDYFFDETPFTELDSYPADGLPYPVVLKPSRGFLSYGVAVVKGHGEWQQAVNALQQGAGEWNGRVSQDVLDSSLFLIEQAIEGQEYAIDVYFDGMGAPVILNIMRHDFAGPDDVSDRAYWTSVELMREKLGVFDAWFSQVNAILGLRNFCLHAEVRDTGKQIIPVEFNPLRFAGICTTDLSHFAWGFFTYDYYLHDKRPDWDTLFEGREGRRFAMMVVGESGLDPQRDAIDFDAFLAGFSKLLSVRRGLEGLGVYAELFAETDPEGAELDWLLGVDLHDYLLSPHKGSRKE